MGESASNSMQPDVLWASDMLGVFVMIYVLIFWFLFVSFINIYSIDKYEFQNNLQSCWEFKRRIPFIIMFSKHKTIISKKTFVLEVVGYSIALIVCAFFVISLWAKVNIAFCMLAFPALITIVFAILVGIMYHKIMPPSKRQ